MKRRPNILLVIADGLRADVLDPTHICRTPSFDRLGQRGVQFTRAYTTSPTCSPARAGMMTGLLPHNHGVLQVENAVAEDQSALRREKPHWAQRLAGSGYRELGYFGKWHLEHLWSLEDFGWTTSVASDCRSPEAFGRAVERDTLALDSVLDDRRTFRLRGAPGYRPFLWYGVSEKPVDIDELPASVPYRFAAEHLDRVLQTAEPWCLCVSTSEPNDELLADRGTFERYELESIALPPNLHDDMAGRPGFYRRFREIWRDVSEEHWKMARACYYARVETIDALFGRLVERIDMAGQLDETIIIVTSDHGRHLGDHGVDGHNFTAFEPAWSVPLIVAGPGIAAGAVVDARVGSHDLCPTILELAGADPIDVPDSRSFASVLRDPSRSTEFTTGFAEQHGTRYGQTQRVFWEGAWKYVFNGFDFDEMYNLDEDPWETRNLAADPAYRDRAVAMMGKIWERIESTSDTTLSQAEYYTMQFGIVGPHSPS